MKQEESGINNGPDLRGKKIALVINSSDPKAQQRVLIRVLGIHDLEVSADVNSNGNIAYDSNYGIWAVRCAPSRTGGDLPEVGDYIWVEFPNLSDSQFIVWVGYVLGNYQNNVSGANIPKIKPKETPIKAENDDT